MLSSAAYLGLLGTIVLRETGKMIDCSISHISENYSKIVATPSNPIMCVNQSIDLRIFIPVERSPIKCTCSISGTDTTAENSQENPVVMSVTKIGRIDRRRLELFLELQTGMKSYRGETISRGGRITAQFSTSGRRAYSCRNFSECAQPPAKRFSRGTI